MTLSLGLAASLADKGGGWNPLTMMLLMAGLSLVPFLLLLLTSFVRIVVVLSILKNAIGASQVPPAFVITGIALIMTIYVMAPTGQRMWNVVEPALAGPGGGAAAAMDLSRVVSAANQAKEPLRAFLLKHSLPKDRQLFHQLALKMRPAAERQGLTPEDFLVAAPAFITAELRRAFEIGFLLFLPFLVVDMVVSNLLLALGMHMLSPTTVSLPFKLLLFVAVDGWTLLLRGLVESYV
jgi:type III secretion protein R